MDKKIRIAVASVDGIDVNSHFGRANKFFIYEKIIFLSFLVSGPVP